MMNKKFSSIFSKYLISYIIVLLIPFFLLFLYIQIFLLPTFRESVESENAKQLKEVSYILDNYFNECSKIVDSINLDKDLTLLKDTDDVITTSTLIDELNKYTLTNTFISSIVFYNQNDEYIFSNTSSHRIASFVENYFPTETIGTTKIYNFIARFSNNESTMNFMKLDDETLVLSIKFNTYNSDEDSKLLFFLDLSYINNILIKDENLSAISVINSNNEAVYSSSNFDNDLLKVIQNTNENNFAHASNIINIYDSDNFALKYISVSSLSDVLTDISVSNILLYSIIVLTFIFEFFVIKYSLKTNYSPIKHILDKISNINTDKKQLNFELIQGSFDYLISQNEYLIHSSSISSRAHLFQRLLRGSFDSSDKFNSEAEPFNIYLNSDYYCVICFTSIKNQNSTPINYIEKCFNKYIKGYLCTDTQNKFVFIASLNELDKLSLPSTLQTLQRELSQIFDTDTVSFGVGGIYSSLSLVTTSYKEAVIAFDYVFIKGPDSIVYQDTITFDNQHSDYPYLLIEKFQAAFSNNNLKMALSALSQIEDYIKNTNCPLFYARSICYDLLSILSNLLKTAKMPNIDKNFYNTYVSLMADLNNCDDVINLVRLLCTSEHNYISENQRKDKLEFIDKINSYINENYLVIDFSIENLASHFNMTLANISNYYKSQTGTTLISHVTKLRLEKAKELLITTDYSINKITEEIGYLSSSSFIRKFKNVYGVTPKQFADSHKNRDK